jgi:bacterioferritin
MEKDKLIEMLNRDLADEHAAIIRYLVHSYLEGEDSPLGAGLLSRSREEMWHMHWLGMIIGALGGEPNMSPAPYPFDPTSRATIFKSYVRYEEKLVPHYMDEAEQVSDPHIRRVLRREAWESAVHAKKFARILGKLSPEVAGGLPGAENELPAEYVQTLQNLVEEKYNRVLQQIRDAWVFQKEEIEGWRMIDFSMTKMKQLAHLAEPVAENGFEPAFVAGPTDPGRMIGTAMKRSHEDVVKAMGRHLKLMEEAETRRHAGLMINLDLMVKQEEYEAEETADRLSGRRE